MSWYSDNVDNLTRLSKFYFVSYVMAKVIGGIGVGLLLATWLPVWTWCIFIAVAVIIAIPVIIRIIYLANKDGLQ